MSEFSLSDIAGIDLDAVKEVRGFAMPVGSYNWKIVHDGERQTGLVERDTKDGKVIFAQIIAEVTEVHGTVKFEGDEADLVGKKHTESFMIKDMDGLGRLKAFLVDSGAKGSGQLGDILTELGNIEHGFKAKIKHRKNPNDADQVFANFTKVEKLEG